MEELQAYEVLEVHCRIIFIIELNHDVMNANLPNFEMQACLYFLLILFLGNWVVLCLLSK
jgi:hypothetical protein